MDPETLFSLASTLAMIGWVVLLLLPRGRPVLDAIPAIIVPMVLSAGYALLVLRHFAGAGGGYGSLADVRALMAPDMMLLAGWVHYLAFDLLIGAALARAMDRDAISRIVQAPLLLLVFLFGPLGYLLIIALRGGLAISDPATRSPKGNRI